MPAPRCYSPKEIADSLEIAEDKLRRIIRDECEANAPDALRLVPGGRVHGNIVRVYSDIYDAITQGRHLIRVPEQAA